MQHEQNVLYGVKFVRVRRQAVAWLKLHWSRVLPLFAILFIACNMQRCVAATNRRHLAEPSVLVMWQVQHLLARGAAKEKRTRGGATRPNHAPSLWPWFQAGSADAPPGKGAAVVILP